MVSKVAILENRHDLLQMRVLTRIDHINFLYLTESYITSAQEMHKDNRSIISTVRSCLEEEILS
jgi:hypothetical protein